MSFTGSEMVAAAEAHYRNAKCLLEDVDQDFESTADWKAVNIANVTAELHAGLLAMELAKYAGHDPL